MPSSSQNAGSCTYGRNTSGTKSSTPGHGPPLPYGLMTASWAKPRMYVPAYYEWRTRSGCYFCFFRRKHEWVGLKDRHPNLFDKAITYEEKLNYQHTAMKDRKCT
ncbi:hypothetical protein GCM10010486_57420 [Nonomuraea roseoviolacea subsp. carminata]